jgi:hypothetical protein
LEWQTAGLPGWVNLDFLIDPRKMVLIEVVMRKVAKSGLRVIKATNSPRRRYWPAADSAGRLEL